MGVLREVLSKLVRGPLTEDFPRKPSPAPEGYRGRHELDPSACLYLRYGICRSCEWVCPSSAISLGEEDGVRVWRVDLGRCIFCAMCQEVCPTLSIRLTPVYELSSTDREAIVLEWRSEHAS